MKQSEFRPPGSRSGRGKGKGRSARIRCILPIRRWPEEAAKAGITAIIQPGGSIRDQEVLDVANKYEMAMVYTGVRHFRH